jgi:acyl-CoA thioester hydrolase
LNVERTHDRGVYRWPVRVYYEDTDAGGIVYHANYLRFMERARTEWLRRLGFEQDELSEREQVIFVVKKIDIDYRAPARFNDEIDVRCAITRCGRASIEFDQDIVRDEVTLCRAQVKVGCVSTTNMRPCAIPTHLYAEMQHAAR